MEQRATPGATPAGPTQCKSSSLCVSITTSEVGLAVPASRKGPALRRPGRLEGQASRASRPAEPRASRPCGGHGGAVAEAALSQRHPCRRAGVAPAGVQVSTKPAAFWSASRKPQPLTSIVPDTICDEAGDAVSRGAASGGGRMRWGVDASKRGRAGGGPCRCTPSTSPRGRRTAGRLHPRSPAPRPRRARTGRAGTRRLCRRRAS